MRRIALLCLALAGCGSTGELRCQNPTTSPSSLSMTVNGTLVAAAGARTVDGATEVTFKDTTVTLLHRVGYKGVIAIDEVDLEIDSVRLTIDQRRLSCRGEGFAFGLTDRDGFRGRHVEIDGKTGKFRILQ